jgi:hypothetical protein
MDRNLLDEMYKLLSGTNDNIAYCYCQFSYILPNGKQILFNKNFNKNALLKQNYISSNSMIKLDKLDQVDGFVCDDRYIRLLDWCL